MKTGDSSSRSTAHALATTPAVPPIRNDSAKLAHMGRSRESQTTALADGTAGRDTVGMAPEAKREYDSSLSGYQEFYLEVPSSTTRKKIGSTSRS